MIIDTLTNAERYFSLHPNFQKAFEFLRTMPLGTLECKRYDILGDDLYVSIQAPDGKPASAARLEFHDAYIDIQYLISGTETQGFSPRETLAKPDPINPAKDCGFAADTPMSWVNLRPGMFTIFFPGDAHAPNVSDAGLRKAVVKVRLR